MNLNSAFGDKYFSLFVHSQALPKAPSRTIQVRRNRSLEPPLKQKLTRTKSSQLRNLG
jgi:hypothetical protein